MPKKPSSTPREPAYSARDAADTLGISVHTLRAWLKEDTAPTPVTIKDNNSMGRMSAGGMTRRLYRLPELKAWIAKYHPDYKPRDKE